MVNDSPAGFTAPSIGVVIVVSSAAGAGSLERSKKATRPVVLPPLTLPSPPTSRPREVASIAFSPSYELEPGFHSRAVPVSGSSAPRWSRRTTWSPRP